MARVESVQPPAWGELPACNRGRAPPGRLLGFGRHLGPGAAATNPTFGHSGREHHGDARCDAHADQGTGHAELDDRRSGWSVRRS